MYFVYMIRYFSISNSTVFLDEAVLLDWSSITVPSVLFVIQGVSKLYVIYERVSSGDLNKRIL